MRKLVIITVELTSVIYTTLGRFSVKKICSALFSLLVNLLILQKYGCNNILDSQFTLMVSATVIPSCKSPSLKTEASPSIYADWVKGG